MGFERTWFKINRMYFSPQAVIFLNNNEGILSHVLLILTIPVKARSDDPFLRIRFLVLKTGSRRSDGPILRFRFCGENVGR